MAPSAVDQAPAAPEEKTYPPANIFPVRETRFKTYIQPQEDGRRRALEEPDGAAIVIDNGELRRRTRPLSPPPLCSPGRQDLPPSGRDGRLSRSRA